MRLRALLLSAAALCAAAPAADAAPKRPAPMCVAYTDAPSAPLPGMEAYDIRRLTVAVGREQLAATLEVADGMDGDPLDVQRLVGGATWLLRMNLDGVDYAFDFEIEGLVGNYEVSSAVTAGGHVVQHALMVQPQSVTWLLKLRDLRVAGKPQDTVHLAAATYRWGGTADTLSGRVRKSARTCTIPR